MTGKSVPHQVFLALDFVIEGLNVWTFLSSSFLKIGAGNWIVQQTTATMKQIWTSESAFARNFITISCGIFVTLLHCQRLRWSRGSVLAFSTQVRGFNPAEAVGFLGRKKILSTPSFGGEVKPWVPCRRFAARKRSLNLRGSQNLGKITGQFLAHSSTFFC